MISKNVSEIKKQKILEIFTYLVLQITALEETPLYYLNLIKVPSEKCCKRGIMLDPALISPLNLLIISPEEFAKKIFSPTKTPSLSLTYINHDLIYGSFNLVESFQNHLKFEMSEHSNQIEQNINRDLKRWSPKVFRDHYGVSMSLKHDLYKPLFTTLDNFYALHGVVGSYNP